jgi:beta-phosphoglucomutase
VISAVLFDLDGTLIETEELKALSYARAAADLRPGEIVEVEVVDAYADDLVGRSREEIATTLMHRFGLEEAARERMTEADGGEPWRTFVRVRLGVYEKLLEDSELLLRQRYTHNIELVRRMRGEGYPTALATMSHRYQVEKMLPVIGLEDAFDVVATMDDVRRGKPDPEIDLLVAQKMGIPPEEFLVIEDSPAGVGAAIAAGMAVIAVPTKLTIKGLRAAGIPEPQWMVEDPQTLPDVVRERIEDAGGRRKEDR